MPRTYPSQLSQSVRFGKGSRVTPLQLRVGTGGQEGIAELPSFGDNG